MKHCLFCRRLSDADLDQALDAVHRHTEFTVALATEESIRHELDYIAARAEELRRSGAITSRPAGALARGRALLGWVLLLTAAVIGVGAVPAAVLGVPFASGILIGEIAAGISFGIRWEVQRIRDIQRLREKRLLPGEVYTFYTPEKVQRIRDIQRLREKRLFLPGEVYTFYTPEKPPDHLTAGIRWLTGLWARRSARRSGTAGLLPDSPP